MRKIDIAYHSPASLSRRDVGTICVIFITLAIGTQYAYLEALAERNQHSEADFFSEDAIGVRFFQQACKLLPDVITLSSLESVQACLLLGIYTLPVDASGLSYVYLNLALKLAIQNGMHRACPKDSVRDGEVRELRDRVWWAVYTIERFVSPRSHRRLLTRVDVWEYSTEGRCLSLRRMLMPILLLTALICGRQRPQLTLPILWRHFD